MRIPQDGTSEFTYCTNIHPGEHLDEVEDNIRSYTLPLKARLVPDRALGLGLRLSDASARTLIENENRLHAFEALLRESDLYVFTLNGFPYGGFHRQRVKDDVYRPDWRTDERRLYTERLIGVLARLLPEEGEGSISTSPLSYKPWLDTDADREHAFHAGALNLSDLAFSLFELRERTGKFIHLGLEPEPDCLIENTAETVDFFKEWLLRLGARRLRKERGLSATQAEEILREHVGICYDTCHFAVEYESPVDALERFDSTGLRISKVQISAALRVPLADRGLLANRLEPFAESTYLHQVVARASDGSLHRFADLPDALPKLAIDEAEEWRIHYHVPLFVDEFNGLQSTRDEILPVLDRTLATDTCRHFEIETYTWDVLPDDLKTDVVTSIEREFNWLLGVEPLTRRAVESSGR